MCTVPASLKVCFLYGGTQREEEAFNTNAIICVTWNCHFFEKMNVPWMRSGRDWDAPEASRELLGHCRPWLLSPRRDGYWWGSDGEGLAGAVWTRLVFPVARRCVDTSSCHAEVEGEIVSLQFYCFHGVCVWVDSIFFSNMHCHSHKSELNEFGFTF